MTISFWNLVGLACVFWILIAGTMALGWCAGQSQASVIHVQPASAVVQVHPAQVSIAPARIELTVPQAEPPTINVSAPAPEIRVMPAALPNIDVHATVRVDTVQALRTTLGPIPVEAPDVDEHGTKLRNPK